MEIQELAYLILTPKNKNALIEFQVRCVGRTKQQALIYGPTGPSTGIHLEK